MKIAPSRFHSLQPASVSLMNSGACISRRRPSTGINIQLRCSSTSTPGFNHTFDAYRRRFQQLGMMLSPCCCDVNHCRVLEIPQSTSHPLRSSWVAFEKPPRSVCTDPSTLYVISAGYVGNNTLALYAR